MNPNPDDAVNLNSFVYVTASITDGDGDTATDTSNTALQITFEDDGPSLGTFTSGIIPNETGTVNGFFGVDFGTDGYHATNAFDITGPTLPGITYLPEIDNADGTTTLMAVSNDANQTPIFSITVRADGTYEFELITPEAEQVIEGLLDNVASGNYSFVELTAGTVEFHQVAGSGTVNVSGGGFGIANNFLGNGEDVAVEFYKAGSVGNDNPGGFGPGGGLVNPDNRYIDKFTFDSDRQGGSSTLTLTWTAYNDATGATETGSIMLSGPNPPIVIDPSIPSIACFSWKALEVAAKAIASKIRA